MKKLAMAMSLAMVALATMPLGASAEDGLLRTEPSISLPLAKLMAQACEDLADAESYPPVSIAIFDQHMNLKLFVRQDGAAAGTVEFARLKGRTAAALGLGTLDLHGFEYGDPKVPLGLQGTDGYTLTPGGRPITGPDGGHLGGVGVSGASGAQDEACASAATEAAKTLVAE